MLKPVALASNSMPVTLDCELQLTLKSFAFLVICFHVPAEYVVLSFGLLATLCTLLTVMASLACSSVKKVTVCISSWSCKTAEKALHCGKIALSGCYQIQDM